VAIPRVVRPRGKRLSFDDAPITIGHYKLGQVGLTVTGTPTFDEHLAAGEYARRSYLRAGWWLGDWLRYGDSRTDWADRIEQAQELTGLARQTLLNLRTLARVAPEQRRPDVDPNLYFPVSGLPPDVQEDIIDMAVAFEWGRREVREEVRVRKRAATVQGQATLEGQYRVVLADCPWLYGQAQPSGSSSSRHYKPMTIEELCKLPVRAHVTRDAVLGFWVPAPLLYDDPGPRDVLTAWGFTYKALIVWDKVKGAGGFYTEGSVELFLICTRGACTPDVPRDLPRSVYVERKTEHSTKPAWFRQYLAKHWPEGRRLELFGRTPAEGWTVFGDDARLWHQAVSA
jgi:N6-adenosine-specific RNA methylase IME4